MIEIQYPVDQKIYCPACGKLILSTYPESVMNECSHLEFLGTNEGGEIDKNNWHEKCEQSDLYDGIYEYVKKTLDDHYVCFTQHGAGEMIEGYTIFKFEES